MKPEELRQLRKRLRLSQSALASFIGVATNTVARWERGELGMRPTTARLIELLTTQIPRNTTTKRKAGNRNGPAT